MQNDDYIPSDQPLEGQSSELASPGARFMAYIIDVLIVLAVFFPILFLPLLLADAGIAFGIMATIAIVIVQFVLLGTRGQTVGKILLKIRIVDARTGEHSGWARLVLLRSIVNGILIAIMGPGTIYFVVDSLFVFRGDHRTIHDLYSSTRVDRVTD